VPTKTNKVNYKLCTIKIKAARQSQNISYEKKIESKNLGVLYRHINSGLTHKCGIVPLRNELGNLVTVDAEKASVLNEHFGRVGVKDDGILPIINSSINSQLDLICFDSNIICGIINQLNYTSSPGTDGFPPIFFKNLVQQLSGPIAGLFTIIFQTSEIPEDWKKEMVKPFFQKRQFFGPQ